MRVSVGVSAGRGVGLQQRNKHLGPDIGSAALYRLERRLSSRLGSRNYALAGGHSLYFLGP
jgi:hypothetical protein